MLMGGRLGTWLCWLDVLHVSGKSLQMQHGLQTIISLVRVSCKSLQMQHGLQTIISLV